MESSRMRLHFSYRWLLILGILVAVVFSATVSAAQTHLKILVSPQSHDRELTSINELVRELNTQSSGTEVFEISEIPTSQDDGQAILDSIYDGSAAMGFVPVENVAAWDSSYIDFVKLFPFRRLLDADRLLKSEFKFGSEIQGYLGELVVLGQLHRGLVSLITDRPIESLKDFEDLDPVLMSNALLTHTVLGSSNTGFEEYSDLAAISQAFNQGLVNAFEINPAQVLESNTPLNVTRQAYILPPHRYSGSVLVANKYIISSIDTEEILEYQEIIKKFQEKNNSELVSYSEKYDYRLLSYTEKMIEDYDISLDTVTYIKSRANHYYQKIIAGYYDEGLRLLSLDASAQSIPQQAANYEPPPPEIILLNSQPKGVFWNSWLTYGGQDTSFVDVSLQQQHQIHVDLSPYSYLALFGEDRGIGSNFASNELKELLAQYEGEEIPLVIRAIAIDDKLILSGQTQFSETVNLSAFGDFDTTKRDRLNAAYSDVLDSSGSIEQLSNEVAAIGFTLNVRARPATRSGCARIGFSVLEKETLLPIDHLVMTVPVGSMETVATADCLQNIQSNMLATGAEAILASAVDHGRDLSRKPDAVLQIFETDQSSGTVSTIVTFVDGTEEEPIVLVWRAAERLSDYVSDGLKRDIKFSRSQTSMHPAPYARTAINLMETIFTGADFVDCDLRTDSCPLELTAKEALRRLRLISETSQETDPATITISVSDVDRKPIFIPFGLFAARSADEDSQPILSKRVTVIQPLPGGRYFDSAETCIGNWNFAVPRTLHGVRDPALKAQLSELPTVSSGAGKWYPNLSDFRRYMDNFGVASVQKSTEGLVILAHHDQDGLWFEEKEENERIRRVHRHRKFPPGSAALIAACSAADGLQQSASLVEELNRKQIDVAIASPFAVGTEFGAQMAVAFTQLVEEATKNHETPTIRQLFEKASNRAAAKLTGSEQTRKAQAETALEYILLGDPALRLCGVTQ
ncbi:hypothetical protein [Thalassospira sp.]|uniref:hypothetical protein n=1 Tax=Thalassospira sp. TaxID=1912094 RepID=UPI0032EB88BA